MKSRTFLSVINTWIIPVCSILILILLIFTWYRVHTESPLAWSVLDEKELSDRFPLGVNTRQQLIENTDVRFKYHNSLTTVLSLTIALGSMLLTFAAFYIQYVFNLRQKNDLSEERFENQYFQLLDIYRNISISTTLAHVGSGKVAFHYMFYEYKALFYLVSNSKILDNPSTEDVNAFTFKLFIDGVSPGFTHQAVVSETNADETEKLISLLLGKQDESEKHGRDGATDSGVKYIMDYRGRNIKIFDGHRPRLTHYFNYVSLILNHISDNKERHLSMLKYFVSELTEHEVGLIYAYARYRAYASPDKKDKFPLLDRIFKILDSDSTHKFKFDSGAFI